MTKSSGNSQQAIALVKFFSEKKHYLAFKDGCSMFRTPHYYRLREDVGRGDRSESCLGYWDKELGDKMPTLINKGDSINIEDAKNILVYPAHEEKDSWLQSWCVFGPGNEFDKSLERMLEEFGAYFVILPAEHIEKYASLVGQASGDQVRYGLVKYSYNPMDRSLTTKDSKFSYQKEFRFYLGHCEKVETQDKELRLEGVNEILPKAGSLKIESPSGEVRYCSQGLKKVVIECSTAREQFS